MYSDPQLDTLISETDIALTVKRLAMEIDQDDGDRPPVVVGVLKGAFVFLSDLLREMQVPILRLELIRLASYGKDTRSSGKVEVLQDLPADLITHQDVLLVEDMVDSGHSIAKALALLRSHQPASVRLCALLDKPARRQVPVEIDYLGLTVPDQFIVGYGMDWNEQYRELASINTLRFAEAPLDGDFN